MVVRRFLILGLLLLVGSFCFWGEVEAQSAWTFMVYMDGDNNLESAAIEDFLELAEYIPADVSVVVQLDRVSFDVLNGIGQGAFDDSSYENWTGCARFKIDTGDTPVLANAEQDLGEVNMGAPATLTNFINWATTNYPADDYALILWNHGGGWRHRLKELKNLLDEGGSSLSVVERESIEAEIKRLEEKAAEEDTILRDVCVDETSGDRLYMKEVREAIPGALDLIGFDACLMGMLEVAHEIKGLASVMVGSEKTEPGDGWPYEQIMSRLDIEILTDTPATPAELGTAIVEEYAASYSNLHTQSAIDLSKVNALSTAVSNFAQTVINEDDDWGVIQNAKMNAGAFNGFRDLYGFIQDVCVNATNANIGIAASQVQVAFLDGCIIANHCQAGLGGNGLSIYFSDDDRDVNANYNAANILFANDTQWDEFLAVYITKFFPAQPTIVFPANGQTNIGLEPALIGSAYNSDLPHLQSVWYISTSTVFDAAHIVWNSGHVGLAPLTQIQVPPSILDENTTYYCRVAYRNANGWSYYSPTSQFSTVANDPNDLNNNGIPDNQEARDRDINDDGILDGFQNWVAGIMDSVSGRDIGMVVEEDQTIEKAKSMQEDDLPEELQNYSFPYGVFSCKISGLQLGETIHITYILPEGVYTWYKYDNANGWYDYSDHIVGISSGEITIEVTDGGIGDSDGVENGVIVDPCGPVEPEVTEGSGSGGGAGDWNETLPCFIATAAYGTHMTDEVKLLREFRNSHLLSNIAGKRLVECYYKVSPPLAGFINSHPLAGKIVRGILKPFIWMVKLII